MKKIVIILIATIIMILSTGGCSQTPIEETSKETLPYMSETQIQPTETLPATTTSQKMETIVRTAPTIAKTTVPTTTVEETTTIVSSSEPPVIKTTEAPTEPTMTEAPRPVYTYKEFEGRVMYVQSSVNVRNLPSIEGEIMTTRDRNEEVWVTGQCNETDWYRIDIEGQTLFISDIYVAESRYVEPTTAAPVRTTPAQPQTPPSSGFVYYAVGNYRPSYDYEKYLYDCLVDRNIAWWFPWAVAQIMQESCWNPSSYNGVDAGICQFNEKSFPGRAVHHANFPGADVWNPYHSLYVYSFFIRDILVAVGYDVDAALSYYITGVPGTPHYDYLSRVHAYYDVLRPE